MCQEEENEGNVDDKQNGDNDILIRVIVFISYGEIAKIEDVSFQKVAEQGLTLSKNLAKCRSCLFFIFAALHSDQF